MCASLSNWAYSEVAAANLTFSCRSVFLARREQPVLLAWFHDSVDNILTRLGDRELARHPVEIIKGQTTEVPRVTEIYR
jgi:hypothetical protein